MSVKCVEPRWGCLACASRVRVWITKAGMKMNSHLPECPVPEMQAEFGPMHPDDAECNCFCDRLKACEQRVRSETCDSTSAEADAYSVGLTAGLHAAWEAIEALPKMKIAGNFPLCDTDDALAAIDSLRSGE